MLGNARFSHNSTTCVSSAQRGVTLIELIVFIVIISSSLATFLAVFGQMVSRSVDPVVQMRAQACAQAKVEQIMARKFDENTPTGGLPACGSAEANAVACAGITADSDFDDVGDFNNQTDTANSDCSISVTVVNAGTDLGLPANQARLITVNVTSPGGGSATLSSYKVNF